MQFRTPGAVPYIIQENRNTEAMGTQVRWEKGTGGAGGGGRVKGRGGTPRQGWKEKTK